MLALVDRIPFRCETTGSRRATGPLDLEPMVSREVYGPSRVGDCRRGLVRLKTVVYFVLEEELYLQDEVPYGLVGRQQRSERHRMSHLFHLFSSPSDRFPDSRVSTLTASRPRLV